jgi:hypothetical protein
MSGVEPRATPRGVRVRHRAWLARLALAASTACASWSPLQSPARGGDPWRELTSEHFTLLTDIDSTSAQRALREFEALRDALEQVAFPPGGASEPRVSIVLFSRRFDYQALGPRGTSGAASANLALDIERQPTILFAGNATDSARRTFVHEEVHELMHRAYGSTPTWLNEGLADYFSTLHVEGDLAVLGDVIPERRGVRADDVLSVAEIVGAHREDFEPGASGAWTAARYYAGAWLLVHFLRDGPEAYRHRFGALAAALDAGQSAEKAWQVAMAGVDASQLESDFRTHVNALSWPRYGQRIQTLPPAPITERPMRPAEVHLLWARLAPPAADADSLAQREIDEAAELEPRSAEVAYARGCLALSRQAKETAKVAFEAALASAPREPRYLLGVALATGDCGSGPSAPKNTQLCESLVATARSPRQNALAAVFLSLTDRRDEALRRARQAFHDDGRCPFCAAVLADLSASNGDTPGAIGVLERSLSASAETPQDRLLATMLEKYQLLGGSSSPSAPSATAPPWCGGGCTRTANEPLVGAVRARAAETKPCYDRALAGDPALRGKMRVTVRVADDGSVCAAWTVASDLPASLNACVLRTLGADGYPPQAAGCREVTVPISFSSDDTK